MATSRIPTQESLDNLLGEIPDEAIEIVCLRVQTADRGLLHYHYTDSGEWTRSIGVQH